MKSVRLYGDLQQFKEEWQLDVQTPGEALRAIEANRPGFLAACDSGDYIAILIDPDNAGLSRQVTPDNSSHPWADELMVVVPRAGGGIPVPFIIASFVATTLGTSVAAAAGMVAAVTNMAIAIAVSAIANVITSDKKKVSASQTERPESRPSYVSNGPVNVVSQGHPYPIIAGEYLCGSVVASSQIHIKDIPT